MQLRRNKPSCCRRLLLPMIRMQKKRGERQTSLLNNRYSSPISLSMGYIKCDSAFPHKDQSIMMVCILNIQYNILGLCKAVDHWSK